jgi:flavodoxin
MKALVVYESMYGNTHQLAEAIAEVGRSGAPDHLTRAEGGGT